MSAGVMLVEVFIAIGVAPLSPLGWPGIFLILAAAFRGSSAALGGALMLFSYFLFTLGAPQRFPHFYANAGVLPFWFIGLGLATAVPATLRGRLMQAHRLQLIAAQNEAEMTALVDYRQWLSTIVDNAPALIGYLDAEQRFRFHNRTYEHWLEKARAEIGGRTLREVFGEEEYQKVKPHLERALQGGRVTFHHEHWLHGELRHAQTSYAPDYDPQGRVRGVFVVAKDIGSVIEKQRELREAQTRTALALGGSNVELWDVNLESGKVYLGEVETTMAALGARVHAEDRETVRRALRDALKGSAQAFVAEYRLVGADGEYRWVLSRGRATQRHPVTRRALRMIGANVDIHERKLTEQATEQRDPGTVATQSLLVERLRRALARGRRSGAPLALMQLDIGGMKSDEAMLLEVAARLRACVRLTDTVARIGAGRFLVLLEGLAERGDALRVAEKMRQAVRQPTSIGIAFPDEGEATPEELVGRAGAALTEAKAASRDAFRVVRQ